MTDRTPLILVPGLLCDSLLWANQIGALGDLADCQVANPVNHDSIKGMASDVLHRTPFPRFALAGLSMGGYGTWDALQRYPDRFAAAVPICGGGDVKQAKKIAQIPIWAFHGGKDTVVPVEESEQLVNRRKWRVVDARPPQPPKREGHIEAVARTLVLGLPEDLTVRVLPDGDGARVDLRSASRYFEGDLGSNAARVTKFAEDLNEAAENAPAPKPEAPAKAAAQTIVLNACILWPPGQSGHSCAKAYVKLKFASECFCLTQQSALRFKTNREFLKAPRTEPSLSGA